MRPATSARTLVHTVVRARVYTIVQQHSEMVLVRQRWTFSVTRLAVWRDHMMLVREMSTVRITSWFPSWLIGWRDVQPALQGSSQSSQSGAPNRDPKHLTPDQLREMLRNSPAYLCHGTRNSSVGTCQEPVEAETIQANMSNPMQAVGVYAFRGITAALSSGYGPYCVVFRFNASWSLYDGAAWIRRGEGSVPEDEVVGWFHEDDLGEARK